LDEYYERLAEALDRLPNRFPRTPSKIEILVLKKIYTEEEARIAGALTREAETVEAITPRIGMTPAEAAESLRAMARKGLLWQVRRGEERLYRLAPFVVGSYEASLHKMDHEFAHLVEEYFAQGGVEGIMRPQPAIHRVLPAQGTVKTEWIMPYEDVRALILSMKTFSVRDCICRAQQEQLGRRCDFPLHLCLSFTGYERSSRPGDITQEEALALLDRAEDLGLVHTVSNVMEGLSYVCNCCGCCCGILRGINEHGIENSVAAANYYGEVDADACVGCGVCVDRCQVRAVRLEDGLAVVDRERCIGCGLCVTGCPAGAARLQRKPEEDIIQPPRDFGQWEEEREKNRQG
jgi:ferredoxin